VYAFCGTVGFWIDDHWRLNECVLELLPLSGDHSGKASGKLIFKALRRRGIETKLSKHLIVLFGQSHLTLNRVQLLMALITRQAMDHLTEHLASISRRLAMFILTPKTCRLDAGAMC